MNGIEPLQRSHGKSIEWKMKCHPELRRLHCHRCEIRYAAIPRYRDTDHCVWCQEEIELGHLVIGVGLEAAGGWLQVPGAEVDEDIDKNEYMRQYRREERRRARWKRCACGKPIDPRSKSCAPCAARAFQAKRARVAEKEMAA